MRIIDLTHTITESMPVYPGTEKPVLNPSYTCEKDGFSETKMCMYSHTGTHIDAPSHLFASGKNLDEFDADQFIGKALVIDCTDFSNGSLVPLSHLNRYGNKVLLADFLLFHFGWDEKWGSSDYFENYPCISKELLDFIVNGNYKGIGLDVISLDPIADCELSGHRSILQNNRMINIENLCNLSVFGDELFCFACLPLKFRCSDGAPCRAIGWIEDE